MVFKIHLLIGFSSYSLKSVLFYKQFDVQMKSVKINKVPLTDEIQKM